MMRKVYYNLTLILTAVILTVFNCGCANTATEENIWDSAVYTEDTELGEGEKTLYLTVQAEEKSVKFTVHSDAKTVGDALQENELIEGEEGAYGLYVKKVNGILADFDTTKSYWAFTKGGEQMVTGVDGEEFSNGDEYELVYTIN